MKSFRQDSGGGFPWRFDAYCAKRKPHARKKELALWGEVTFQRFSALGMGDSVEMDVQGIK